MELYVQYSTDMERDPRTKECDGVVRTGMNEMRKIPCRKPVCRQVPNAGLVRRSTVHLREATPLFIAGRVVASRYQRMLLSDMNLIYKQCVLSHFEFSELGQSRRLIFTSKEVNCNVVLETIKGSINLVGCQRWFNQLVKLLLEHG